MVNDASLIKLFEKHGFNIIAVLDTDSSKGPKRVGDLEVMVLGTALTKVRELRPDAAVVAVSEKEAQTVADALIAAGIRAILNLTPTVITAPPEILVRNVDIVAELFALSYYCGEMLQRRDEAQ